MKIRNLPSWFWGGLITSVVFTLLDFVKELMGKVGWAGSTFIQEPLGFNSQGFLQSDFMLWVFTLLFYFVIGAIISAVVYNIKKESR